MSRKPSIKRTWSDCWLNLILWIRNSVRKRNATARSIIFPGHLQRLITESEFDSKLHMGTLQKTYQSWRFKTEPENFELNKIRNQKYSIVSFLPLTLVNQFRYFFNIFYLVVGVSQLCPQFQIGPLFTYLAPLGFVVSMSLAKEAIDDFKRFRRDMEINNQMYEVVAPFSRAQYQERIPRGPCSSARDLSVSPFSPQINAEDDIYLTARIPAAGIRTGHVLKLHAGQRVPCDMLLLKTLAPESDGTTFVRTDQLDGETDWKLRRAVATTQQCALHFFPNLAAVVDVEPPRKEIYEFNGSITFIKKKTSNSKDMDVGRNTTSFRESLNLDNTLWTNSVVTSGPILVLALFTGKETRAALHTTKSRTKMGRFDLEVNRMSKFLCSVLLIFAFFLTSAKPLSPLSSIYFVRFVLLLSSIIPISLRVNLDMAKIVYSFMISQDPEIPGTVVRNSQLPEELGRIDVLFSDKTGTITKNKMTLQKIGIAGKIFVGNNINVLSQEFRNPKYQQTEIFCKGLRTYNGTRNSRVRNMIGAMALCHSVMPIRDELLDCINYQASSPDEMALVQFCAQYLGIRLVNRSDQEMQIEISDFADKSTSVSNFKILELFPFSSSRKRMGIVLQEASSGRIYFLVKGAEVVILPRLAVQPQWLTEEIDSFARSGLRSLVFAGSELSPSNWGEFKAEYCDAKTSLIERDARCTAVIEKLLEKDLELLGITGVEDELQRDVAETMETLGQAGIKIWMLTGDKTETALCIATSAGLRSRNDTVVAITSDTHRTANEIGAGLSDIYYGEGGTALLGRRADGEFPLVLCLDGQALDKILQDPSLSQLLVNVSSKCRAVLCCRCSPTQKSQIVKVVKTYNPTLRLAAVGDGGNDVPMIQTADCGIGIVGLEGKQASLASEFSITEFKHLKRLLLWHGRLAHQRSANLSGFVVHRGLVISSVQVIFSCIFYFTPLALFQGWLQVGYATYYTMLPVFSLVLDVDLPENVAFLFPELYNSQKTEGGLSDKAFFKTLFKSIYQGAVIMLGVVALFERQMTNIVSIAFTSLILSELLNVTSEIMTWHPLMIAAELLTVLIYSVSLLLLKDYFDIHVSRESFSPRFDFYPVHYDFRILE
eukprot:Gregarina_sp_Poly_1__10202@NODE_704_length_6682_cov_70_537566_g531_i0_p1_GENE_NODE_704_length_6682_cov_70_537566_g531_i0NODE_704_length_6682_cov_70_537566_g531_i0_p1_ORF_typecomplete_len1111_score153_04PhoLip_ATPase_C/PF16212_5/1_4e03PhoLip_ATPase_C/PF16212_5/6_5e47Hydrolase/PF00702_26/1_4e36E1E2_ATPase/PF00122_20/2_1e22Cation_ATPase/PF13246_6/9_5e17Cation_ATPase/PF13246_6/2_4e02PhoLip_ATPase_N/PF16209_5/3_7e15PhoLip_ATPase_N/PF16209_5/9_4e03Hydrolase_3/PF08282_12/0_00055HAD/PF12710_7/6_9e03HAD/